jgi:hypothetical protein
LHYIWINCAISVYFLTMVKNFMLISYSQSFFKKDY